MTQLQQWTFQTCMVCLVAGVLDYLSATNHQKKVLKFILTLYILVSAFVQANENLSFVPFEIDFETQTQEIQLYDTNHLVIQQAQQQLSEQFSQKYQTPVSIKLTIQEQEIIVQAIEVDSKEILKKIGNQLKQDFGIQATVKKLVDE